MKPLDQWAWPAWMEAMAATAPNPDAFPGVSAPTWLEAGLGTRAGDLAVISSAQPLPAPSPLDWVRCGLPAPGEHEIERAVEWLRRPTATALPNSILPAARSVLPPPAWPFDPVAHGPADQPWEGLDAPALTEAALLVLIRRGANPWHWSQALATGLPGTTGGEPLGHALVNGYWTLARAMLAHPACPPIQALAATRMLAHQPGTPETACQPMGLLDACVATDRLEGVRVLLDAWLPVDADPASNPLRLAHSLPVLQALLESDGVRVGHVFQALAHWHGPIFSKSPKAAAFLPAGQAALRDWWCARGPGTRVPRAQARTHWIAHRALALAMAHACGALHGKANQISARKRWDRQLAVLDACHLPVLPHPAAPADLTSAGQPHREPVPASTQQVPTTDLARWLAWRTTWRSPSGNPAQPPDADGMEHWLAREQQLGVLGNFGAWMRAWSASWWCYFPPMDWTLEKVEHARRLWDLPPMVTAFPNPGWAQCHDARALARIPAPVRQALGQACLEALATLPPAAPTPMASGVVPANEATGAHLRWLEWARVWLEEVPDWTPRAPTPGQAAALAAQDWLSPSIGTRLLASWQSRALAGALPAPSPAQRLVRL